MHANMIEDERGDLVDILYYCSQACASEDDAPQPSYWPGGMELEYCVDCHVCGTAVEHGIVECSHERVALEFEEFTV